MVGFVAWGAQRRIRRATLQRTTKVGFGFVRFWPGLPPTHTACPSVRLPATAPLAVPIGRRLCTYAAVVQRKGNHSLWAQNHTRILSAPRPDPPGWLAAKQD